MTAPHEAVVNPSTSSADPAEASTSFSQDSVPSVAATAGVAGAAASTAAQYIPPPPVHHLPSAPVPATRSMLPTQLKRLAYVVSLLLGGSAIFAGLWSVFILPLLHATYSARNAVAGAQRDRWQAILAKIQGIRNLGLFPALEVDEAHDSLALKMSRTRSESRSRSPYPSPTKKGEKGEKDANEHLKASQDLALARSRSPDSPRSAAISIAHTEPVPPKLHADTSSLGTALRDLAAGFDATATTRTSLLSTLEGYTSGLHRELYLTRSGGSSAPWSVPGANSRVGLNTLSANLAKEGGGIDSSTNGMSPLGLPPARSEEWDSVRREVRAIKGLLLNRRNFAVPARAG